MRAHARPGIGEGANRLLWITEAAAPWFLHHPYRNYFPAKAAANERTAGSLMGLQLARGPSHQKHKRPRYDHL